MHWWKKERITVEDEYSNLYQLLQSLHKRWENSELFLNGLEDNELLEEWTYKTLLYKQAYRYILRLMKEHYEGVIHKCQETP